MKQRLIQQVGRSARLKVINELKRSQGLCVADLARRLDMSYMGVKDICLDLEKRGLVDTWRKPGKTGRPQMLYRLTQRTQDLFAGAEETPMILEILEAAQRLFGTVAAEKLLLVVFQKLAANYGQKVDAGSAEERARQLAKLRDAEGYLSRFERGHWQQPWRVLEYHNPMMAVLRAFPTMARMESEVFEKVIGVPVQRVERTASGLYEVEFTPRS